MSLCVSTYVIRRRCTCNNVINTRERWNVSNVQSASLLSSCGGV